MRASGFCFLSSTNSLFWVMINLPKFLATIISLDTGKNNKKGKITQKDWQEQVSTKLYLKLTMKLEKEVKKKPVTRLI